MRFYVRHWYSLDLIVTAALCVALALNWGSMAMVQRLVLLNLIVLTIHQFEEYGFPGGEPAIMNRVLQGSDQPDRFPLNQFSAMFTNVIAAFILYGLPFFFPDAIWLSLAPMLFNFGQLMVHGVATNRTLHGFYNPGLAAVVFLHLPISIYFIWYVCSTGTITGWDWLWGFLYAAAAGGLLVGFMTYAVFASRKTTWPFAPEEMARFDVEGQIAQRGVAIASGSSENAKGPFAMMQRVQRRLHPQG